MIDPKRIRERYNEVKAGFDARHYPPHFLENFVRLDLEWRQAQQEIDLLKNQRNQLTPKGKPTPEQFQKLKELADTIKSKQDRVQTLEQDASHAALYLPNVPHASVPVGKSEENNIEVRQVGKPRDFSFTPKAHHELGTGLNILDFERATAVSGARSVMYRGQGAKLERALINFMLDTHTTHHGYTEIIPSVMVNSASMTGTGQLPKFGEDSFKLTDTDLWLSPTSEVQLTNAYQNTILNEEELPLKLTAYTPCFRKEAGSYGKDMAGIIRLHQFNKVELVKLVHPDQSWNELETLLNNAETILQLLELPYRVITLCTGDMGFTSAKTYDIEVWFPAQGKYREISSCSNFLDFQARRAMIRYKQKDSGKVQYLHTLNGSGLAVGRTWAALVENFQNEDGSISVPDKLKPYMGRELLS